MQNSICCNRSVLRASYNCVFNLYVHCRLMGSLNELSYASHHISNSKWSYAMHAAIQCVVIYWWSSQNNITIGRCRPILQHGYFKTNSRLNDVICLCIMWCYYSNHPCFSKMTNCAQPRHHTVLSERTILSVTNIWFFMSLKPQLTYRVIRWIWLHTNLLWLSNKVCDNALWSCRRQKQ